MNPVIDVLMKRRSVRAYEEREIRAEVRAEILKATLRAPTAGNMMLYSIVDVTDQKIKDKLAVTCDHQPFIARAPMVWLFVADYQRWFDYFLVSGVEEVCKLKSVPMRKPEEGDLFLACCDALIAAQTAVVAAESFGIGSCYIGDIMEQYETHSSYSSYRNMHFQFACSSSVILHQNKGTVPIQSVLMSNLFFLKTNITDSRKRNSAKCLRSEKARWRRGRTRKALPISVKPCISTSSTQTSLSR